MQTTAVGEVGKMASVSVSVSVRSASVAEALLVLPVELGWV